MLSASLPILKRPAWFSINKIDLLFLPYIQQYQKENTFSKLIFTTTAWHNGESWLLSLVTLIDSIWYTSFIAHGTDFLHLSLTEILAFCCHQTCKYTQAYVFLSWECSFLSTVSFLGSHSRAAVTY